MSNTIPTHWRALGLLLLPLGQTSRTQVRVAATAAVPAGVEVHRDRGLLTWCLRPPSIVACHGLVLMGPPSEITSPTSLLRFPAMGQYSLCQPKPQAPSCSRSYRHGTCEAPA
ncbi:hypothetical protein EDB87DRAFT_1321522 [Lactarius vividus]|nr:hypothetical protein EDB87DRAFT_1321522 [Lactarius vividus]